MVTTRLRRRRASPVVPESPSASPELSVRDIDIEPVALRKDGSVASGHHSSTTNETPPPATPPETPPVTPPGVSTANATMPSTDRTVRSYSAQSMVSFAGPGQRGAQLLSVAPSLARNSYLNALENLNDDFAMYLRENDIPLPRCEYTLPPYARAFASWRSTSIRVPFPFIRIRVHLSGSRPCWLPIMHAFALPTHSRSPYYTHSH